MLFSLKGYKILSELKPISRIALASIFSIFQNGNVFAQDIHFSQFYTTPTLINPATTGIGNEDLRISGNYRDQWAKIGVPYKTFYASVDEKLNISNQALGIGVAMIDDQSSAFNLSADEFLLSLSYSKVIDNQQFVIGIQPAFVYKSYNQSGMTFGSQFDPLNQDFNSNLPSSESGLNDKMHYFDLNAGIFWRTLIREIKPSAGISVSHLIKPVESFSNSSGGEHLPMKLTVNCQANIPLNSKYDITPCILYGYTSGANELLAGGTEDYAIHNFFIPVKNVYAITMCRINLLRDIDALILGAGVKFVNFDLGVTYDFNISPLNSASNFNGAFEISLIFTGGNRAQRNINEHCDLY
jgi:type IX secretion system PorP/SprF family membrane protein